MQDLSVARISVRTAQEDMLAVANAITMAATGNRRMLDVVHVQHVNVLLSTLV